MIDAGRFKPDASRAELLSMLVANEEENGDAPIENEEELQLEESEDESENWDQEEVGRLQSGLDDLLEPTRDPVPGEDDSYLWYIHAFTGVVHVAIQEYEEQEVKLACFYALTANLVKSYANSAEVKRGLFCIQCSSALKKFQEEQSEMSS